MWVKESGMVKFTKELQPAKAKLPTRVTEFGMVNLANVWQSLKASSRICVSALGTSTTSNSSESTIAPRPAIASLLEHITLFVLKTTLKTVSSASPASNTFESLASKWLSPKMTSTPVVLQVSSSQGCPSLICCLSARPVWSGMTSRTRIPPLGCTNEMFFAMAQRLRFLFGLELVA